MKDRKFINGFLFGFAITHILWTFFVVLILMK